MNHLTMMLSLTMLHYVAVGVRVRLRVLLQEACAAVSMVADADGDAI